MPDMLLKRHVTEDGVYGFLIGEGNIPVAVTLELPPGGIGEKMTSFPMGVYRCERTKSILGGEHYETFEVMGVKGRSRLLFHWGMHLSNTKGCVLLGQGFGAVDGLLRSIVNTRKAFNLFMKIQKGVNEFTLHVINT